MAHHTLQPGEIAKPNTRWIWNVFWLLLGVTLIEVVAALPEVRDKFPAPWTFKTFLITFTLIKAGFIVGAYMHLKDEMRNLIVTILLPFFLIIYLIVLVLIEGSYVSIHRTVLELFLMQ